MYSSNPRWVGIYRSYTWASRWASIHGLTYTPTRSMIGLYSMFLISLGQLYWWHEVPEKTAITIYFNALGDKRNRSGGNYDVSSSDFIVWKTSFFISHFLLPLQTSETVTFLITTNDILWRLNKKLYSTQQA